MRFLLFFLAIGWSLATAQAATPTDADIDALLRTSGMQGQINQIPQALKIAGQQQDGLGAGLIKPLVDALGNVFDPQEMQRMMRAEVIRQLDTDTLVAAMTWFNSAESQSILAAEQRLFDPAVMEQIATAMDSGTVASLTPARRQLLQEIDQASGATEAALDMMMNMQAAFLTAFSHLLMPDQANEFSATLASFAGTRDQYRTLVQDQLLLQQAVLMEPVTDSALQQLRDFARSDAGHKTLVALNNALNITVHKMAERIPDAMTLEEQARMPPATQTNSASPSR